jgi:hypothetical protein
MQEIALAASKKGRVNILEWAGLKGFDFDAMAYMDGALSKPALCLAAQNGHISVLEWLK